MPAKRVSAISKLLSTTDVYHRWHKHSVNIVMTSVLFHATLKIIRYRYDLIMNRSTVSHKTILRHEPVSGSPFTCRMINSVHATASGVGIERVAVRRPAIFHVTLEDGSEQITSDELPIVNITGKSYTIICRQIQLIIVVRCAR
jgi:hypothetical protein